MRRVVLLPRLCSMLFVAYSCGHPYLHTWTSIPAAAQPSAMCSPVHRERTAQCNMSRAAISAYAMRVRGHTHTQQLRE